MVQNRHTFADAAYVFLRENDGELHYKELARQILDVGYFVSRGKTPEQTLRSQISREIKQAGDEARFVNQGSGVLTLSDYGREQTNEELVTAVHDFAERQKKKDAKKAAKKKAEAPAEPEAEAKAESKAEAPAEPEAQAPAPEVAPAPPVAAEAAAAPTSEATPAAAPEDPDTTGAGAFIPIDLGDDLDYVDLDDASPDGTFASPEQEVGLLEDPDDEDGEASARAAAAAKAREEDDEKDFLSIGQDLRDMKSNEYHASMDELAPIVVPPHEGGAAEIARLPMGGRAVLIIKVVRRHGRAQIQLVEELESLISGVVGRLLLTLPGEDLSDLLEALLTCRKVIQQSFVGGEDAVHEAVYLD